MHCSGLCLLHMHTHHSWHTVWSLTVKGFKFHNYSTCHHQFIGWNIKRVSAGNRRVSVIKWRNNPGIVSKNAQQRNPTWTVVSLDLLGAFSQSQLYKERGLNSCQGNQPINPIKSNSVCLKQRFDPGLKVNSAHPLSTSLQPDISQIGRPGRTSSFSWWFHIHWTLGSCTQYYL